MNAVRSLLAAGVTAMLCISCVADLGREEAFARDRDDMVRLLKAYYGIKDERILDAMRSIRRHAFIPEEMWKLCNPYGDHPCPIGMDQTVSQPFIVAYMTERLAVKPGEKVLEIGTGSGYQAAVLAQIGAVVFSIEIIPELATRARATLDAEGVPNVRILTGDGYKGWPEHAPFDCIIVTCAPEEIPPVLVEQLVEGGRMILPVGVGVQRLVLLRKKNGVMEKHEDIPVRFVPMVRGDAGRKGDR